ncbi:MucBP domain-containing protein, partial [Enterococcus faecalis]|uniref:MucBP domain-containing protein n=1 Tax=Enterococcus faecalis TaxID=1351 RepID=UPI003D0DF5EF
NVGESYTTEQKDIPGYTFKEVKGNATGTFSSTAQTVTYVYKANATVNNVTVKYVDEQGKEIHESQTISGKLGEAYDATTKVYKLAIPWYTLDEKKLPTNATGTFSNTAQTITYVYKADGTKKAAKAAIDEEATKVKNAIDAD